MRKANILTKKKLLGFLVLFELVIFFLAVRIFFIQVCQTNFWQEKAYEQQTRDRLIKPNRGMIFDRNMISLAKTQSVNSISVIHAQIKEPEKLASVLAKKLALDYDETLKKINKRVALERIKTKKSQLTHEKKTYEQINNQMPSKNLSSCGVRIIIYYNLIFVVKIFD